MDLQKDRKNIESIEENLEWEIEDLLNQYLKKENEKHWDSHLLKLKNKKNLLLLRPKYFFSKSSYLLSNEQFAHYYTILDLPDISFINKIIFLPKFIETQRYFLTNLYLMKEKIFIFYLTPIRFLYSAINKNIEFYKNIYFAKEMGKERIVLQERFNTKFQNLFYILDLVQKNNKDFNTNVIKFIEEKEKLNFYEAEEMRKIHDFFLFQHPLNKI
jgi:hypothetical protein